MKNLSNCFSSIRSGIMIVFLFCTLANRSEAYVLGQASAADSDLGAIKAQAEKDFKVFNEKKNEMEKSATGSLPLDFYYSENAPGFPTEALRLRLEPDYDERAPKFVDGHFSRSIRAPLQSVPNDGPLLSNRLYTQTKAPQLIIPKNVQRQGPNKMSAYFGPRMSYPMKRQILFRQCFFNPISCF